MSEKDDPPAEDGAPKDGSEGSADRHLARMERLLADLPPEDRAEFKELITEEATFRGPLPPPALFQKYDQVLPGAAERILALTEREQIHRQAWDMEALRGEVGYGRLGLWLGAGALLLDLLVVAFCAWIGAEEVAWAAAGIGLVGIVGSFIRGRRFAHQDSPPDA